jgi:hypothetical protein
LVSTNNRSSWQKRTGVFVTPSLQQEKSGTFVMLHSFIRTNRTCIGTPSRSEFAALLALLHALSRSIDVIQFTFTAKHRDRLNIQQLLLIMIELASAVYALDRLNIERAMPSARLLQRNGTSRRLR